MKNILLAEEIEVIRSQKKDCAGLIHFNNAGASLPPDVVVDTVIDYLREEALVGGYETEAKYLDRINGVYDKIAQFNNANPEEVQNSSLINESWIRRYV